MRHADAGYDSAVACATRAGPEPADGRSAERASWDRSRAAVARRSCAASSAACTTLGLQADSRERIRASAAVVQARGRRRRAGLRRQHRLRQAGQPRASAPSELDTLQLNLIRSHSVGVGEPLAPEVVRLMLALKAASLARGHSGVREEVVDTLLAVHNAGLVPYVPAQGSVGASGDLAPLAHLTLALLGEGEMLVDGRRRPALRGAASGRHHAADAAAKEGLALINGTQVSTALALHALFAFEPVLAGGAGRRRADGRRGARQRRPLRPAHPRAARPAGADRRGARPTARCSPAARSAARTPSGDDRVQDPYSLRCQPQVVGACLDQLRHAARCCCARPMPSPTTRWCSPPRRAPAR